ncbi:zinc finger protein-like protein [Xylogone sp. PMI_703]|nr:zinc finger protein-like protein [Xylogone sp. PMI_703]
MEGQSPAGKSQYQYQSDSWSRLVRRNTLADNLSKSASPVPIVSTQVPTHLDLLPILLPLQPSFHQEQLDRYNRLITSGRTARLHSSPVPPLLSAQHIQAVPGQRFGSSGGNTDKSHKSSPRTGHGNKDARKSTKGERPLITEKEVPKMPVKKFDTSKAHPAHPLSQHHNANSAQHSSSVPSTPHQHARKFSFESREPSPTATNNHSPRSAYSESNSILPSLRPLPPPRGCRYETAMAQARRRMAYSIGTEKLEDVKSSDLKSQLTEEEEKKLSTDMRELYERLLPTPESDAKRKKLVEKLVTLLNNEWPGHDIQVHVFGSSGNLLCTDESDVDICITTPWKELEGVCMIAELLARSGMERVICVSSAKVPIVKIWDPELSLACDMNVNNVLALENTRMVKTYVQIDPRVRPLAMIVKYWTKRRILNDAAFGGTLSSYTWICLIIYFLQNRNPPILPTLHDWPGARLPTKDGKPSTFADDLEQFKNYGQKNEETLGQLLFYFFRFYGHEFDYDNVVVSVRGGKKLTKFDKKWHLSNNNRLCVEEPFNITRNLGNTADDTSFRGLHMELRRAFDLISEAKLSECCQQYEYPPEEERVWERRAPAPRPILSRSTSQSGRGRGGTHRGGRHSSQHNRNGTGNRRASSGAFDNIASYVPQVLPPNMPAQDLWFAQQANAQLHNDLFASYSLLQAQETSLRMQLLAQQSQTMAAQAQAYAQSQARMQGSGGSAQQPTDRNRTPTYEQPPLTAPIRPDSYFYPLQYQAAPIYAYHNPSTSPSSPSLTSAVPDLERRMHRSTVANGSGAGAGVSSSSLRSQSQPASRTAQVQAAGMVPQSPNGLGIYHPLRQNGILIPSFIADEAVEPHLDAGAYRTHSNSPPEDRTPKEYVGYYVNDHPASPANRKASLMPAAIPAFGDIAQSRRRLSQDQLPQSILDRLRRPSRSPSPLGHERSFSTGAHSAPMTSTSSQQGTPNSGLRSVNNHGPLVVNGSGYSTPAIGINRHITTSESSVPEDVGYETAVGSVDSMSQASTATATDLEARSQYMRESRTEQQPMLNGGHAEPVASFTTPLVVNGSSSQHVNITSNGTSAVEQTNSNSRPSPNPRARSGRHTQNGGVSPLDIGAGQNDVFRDESSYLSPVYEIKTPSPTTSRKFEPSFERKPSVNGGGTKDIKAENQKNATKFSVNGPSSPTSKTNGHTRGSKSESGPLGTWQKIPKNKKKGQELKSAVNGQSQSERPPHNESERKGG